MGGVRIQGYGYMYMCISHLDKSVERSDVWFSVFDGEMTEMEIGELRHDKVNLRGKKQRERERKRVKEGGCHIEHAITMVHQYCKSLHIQLVNNL